MEMQEKTMVADTLTEIRFLLFTQKIKKNPSLYAIL